MKTVPSLGQNLAVKDDVTLGQQGNLIVDPKRDEFYVHVGGRLSDEVLEALRLRAIRARELGYRLQEIAQNMGVCVETVCRWCSACEEGGCDALPQGRTGRSVGSGPRVCPVDPCRSMSRVGSIRNCTACLNLRRSRSNAALPEQDCPNGRRFGKLSTIRLAASGATRGS